MTRTEALAEAKRLKDAMRRARKSRATVHWAPARDPQGNLTGSHVQRQPSATSLYTKLHRDHSRMVRRFADADRREAAK